MQNKILAANQKILKIKYPDIYEELLDYDTQRQKDLEENQITNISFTDTREETKALVVEKAGTCIRLNSKYYPLREAKQWAEQFEYQNISTNAIIYGIGNGIFVRELLNRLKLESCLFIVEPDYSIFAKMIEQIDLSDILGNPRVELYFYHRDKNKALERISACVSWANIDMTIRTIHPGYDKLFDNKIGDYQVELARICEKVDVHINTLAEYSESAVYNVIHNLQYIKESNYINELIDAFPKDYPAVVVSAGPSLQKNVEKLRLLQDKAFILVVDTAVKVMEERQIPYDAMVLVDPEKPAEFLTEYPNCKTKPLFCPTVSQADILDFHKGRKIWLPNSVWIEGAYKKYGMEIASHSVGGSVATTATEVARIIGLKTIILVGQDLAYLGEQTHAGREEAMGEERGYISRWVEGINGEEVRTRWDWIYYLHWYEKFVKENPEITLIDATEGGALIHGSQVMTLAEVIQTYAKESFSFAEFMNKTPHTFDTHDYSAIHNDIMKMRKDMEELAEKCKEGLQYLDIFQEDDSHSLQELDQALLKCMRLNQEFVQVEGYELIEIGTTRILKDKLEKINYISEDERKDKANTAQMLMDYYHAVIEVSEKITRQFADMNIV